MEAVHYLCGEQCRGPDREGGRTNGPVVLGPGGQGTQNWVHIIFNIQYCTFNVHILYTDVGYEYVLNCMSRLSRLPFSYDFVPGPLRAVSGPDGLEWEITKAASAAPE